MANDFNSQNDLNSSVPPDMPRTARMGKEIGNIPSIQDDNQRSNLENSTTNPQTPEQISPESIEEGRIPIIISPKSPEIPEPDQQQIPTQQVQENQPSQSIQPQLNPIRPVTNTSKIEADPGSIISKVQQNIQAAVRGNGDVGKELNEAINALNQE